MMRVFLFLSLFTALLFMTTLTRDARAQDKVEKPDITLEVDGLACPFCAYGLEKKLRKLNGVAALEVQIDEGRVKLKLKEHAQVSEEQLRKAVADAGFTVRKIIWAIPEADGSGRGSSS